MNEPIAKADPLPISDPPRRDRGMSFLEVLVAVVLLGTAVVGTLTALRATVIASAIERDHGRAHEWLQSASELLVNDVPWLDCDTTTAGAIAAQYETDLRAQTGIVPTSWIADQLRVPIDAAFAGPGGSFGTTCYATLNRQLITIQITDTNGDIVETVEVVKIP